MASEKAATFPRQDNTFSSSRDRPDSDIISPSVHSDPFYDILDNLDAIVFVADLLSHKIVYANRYAKDLFGDVVGQECWKKLQTGMSGPCSFCTDKDLVGTDGKPEGSITYELRNTITGKWYEVRERAVELQDGQIVRVHLATDITAKKEVDTALKISEEKYRTVADYTYDWECWIREDRSYHYISPSCERITGYRADEFFSDPGLMHRIVHPQDRKLFADHQEMAFSSREYSHLDFRIITRSGEERWISHYCQPVYDREGTFLGRRSSNRDVTARVESERKTKLSELRLKTLVNLYEKKELPTEELCEFVLESSLSITCSTMGFMGFLDDNELMMNIHVWSKSLSRVLAREPGHLEFNVWRAGMLGEAVRRRRPVVVNDFSAFSAAKEGIPEGHLEVKRFLAVPLLFDNRVVAVLAVANKDADYTHDDVEQLYLLLEGMWQILLKKRAEEDIDRQTTKIKHLVNAVSHDLKSPAISVHGFATLLKEKYRDILDERGLKYCDQIVRAAEQITSLSEDINTYITSKDNGCEIEPLELNELWDIVREEFLPQLKSRNINWQVSGLESMEIRGNRMGLLRIFRNLIDNALKYGGTGMTEIVLGYESSDDHHILTVKNNGEIIMPEDERIIFEEFARKTNNPHIYGTGLGLAIVREIARKHQGTAWLTTCEKGKPVFCISISRHL